MIRWWHIFGAVECTCVIGHKKVFWFFGQRRHKKWFKQHRHED